MTQSLARLPLFHEIWRRGLAYLARNLAGLRIKEIAQHFNRDPMTISLGIQKVKNLLQRDRELAKRMEIIGENLRKKGKGKQLITIAQSTRLMIPAQEINNRRNLFQNFFLPKSQEQI